MRVYGAIRSGLRITCLAGALIIGERARAAGIPVVDIPHTIQSTLNQINTYSQRFQDAAEYGENATRWTQTLNHYRQQLVRIKGIVMTAGLPQGQLVSKVDAEYMVADRCGQGIGPGDLSSVFGLDPSGSIVEQQRQICASIQRMRNVKYNYTVEFFQDYVPRLEGELRRLESERNASNDEGNVSASNNNALQIGNAADARFQAWLANVQAYDAYIAAMEGNQRLLARLAMKGGGSPLGVMVRTAALERALEGGE